MITYSGFMITGSSLDTILSAKAIFADISIQIARIAEKNFFIFDPPYLH